MTYRFAAFAALVAATAATLSIQAHAADPAQTLPAGDNVQAQTQAKVRPTHATPHHGFRHHKKKSATAMQTGASAVKP